MKWNEALRLLEDCERGLRALVSQAAGEGDYPAVRRLTDLAQSVAALATEGRSTQMPVSTAPAAANAKLNLSTAPVAAPAAAGRKSRPADAYPRFFRRGDELVKVGWSKKDRKEYHHRASRRAVDAVAAAVRVVGAKGKLFNGDALLPLKDPADGSAIPDYQAYVALAWLKSLGIVVQVGRRAGYTLAADQQIDGTITTAWPGLAEWRGHRI